MYISFQFSTAKINLTLTTLVCKTDHLVVKRRHRRLICGDMSHIKTYKKEAEGKREFCCGKTEMNLVQRAWREALRKSNCRPRGVEPDGHGLYVNTTASHCSRSLRTLCLHLRKEFSTREQWWIYDSRACKSQYSHGHFCLKGTVHLKNTNLSSVTQHHIIHNLYDFSFLCETQMNVIWKKCLSVLLPLPWKSMGSNVLYLTEGIKLYSFGMTLDKIKIDAVAGLWVYYLLCS